MWPFKKKEQEKPEPPVRCKVILYGKNGGEIKSWTTDSFDPGDRDAFEYNYDARYVRFYVKEKEVIVMGNNITIEDL